MYMYYIIIGSNTERERVLGCMQGSRSSVARASTAKVGGLGFNSRGYNIPTLSQCVSMLIYHQLLTNSSYHQLLVTKIITFMYMYMYVCASETNAGVKTEESSLFGEWHLGVDLVVNVVAEQLVIEIDGNGFLIDGKHLHGVLHPVKGGGLPDKVDHKVVLALDGYPHVGLELETNLLRKAVGTSQGD